MSYDHRNSITHWAVRHSLFVWLGIALNLVVAVPLLWSPDWILGTLRLPLDQPVWGRLGGFLVIVVSSFYVPAAIDLQRYRVNAWLAILLSRSGGALFFFLAVFVYDQPPIFLVGALVEGSVALATLYCLSRVEGLERSYSERVVAA